MITVEEALAKIDENVKAGNPIQMDLLKAFNLVLAGDVFSPLDMPPFPQSAMDGYAVKLSTTNVFKYVGEIKAGDSKEPQLNVGEAIRIFTGAPVPKAADVVVRQEDCKIEGNEVKIEPIPSQGANIRPQAEQIANGEVALQKGQLLNAAAVGYLATLGITQVQVYANPKVALLVTGNELVAPGTELNYGQVYESNAVMLQSALKTYGINECSVYRVKDDYEETKVQLKELLAQYDMILCSGGISVGDYDFVGKALHELNVEEIFYKIKQKPGKPLFFGKKENTLVFALPGNPAAALTCFNVYVVKTLNILCAKRTEGHRRVYKKINKDFTRKGDRAQFLKAAICGEEVAFLEGQSSAMLHTYAVSNTLIYVPIDKDSIAKGELVECILIG